METITKIDELSVKITTPKEEVMAISDLKQKVIDAQNSLDEFERWVLAEREARQKIIADALARVSVIDAIK